MKRGKVDLVTIVLVISMGLALWQTIDGMDETRRLRQSQELMESEKYQTEIRLAVDSNQYSEDNDNRKNEIDVIPSVSHGNVSIHQIGVMVGSNREILADANFVVSKNEDSAYSLAQGTSLSQEDVSLGERKVLIGTGILPYVTESEGVKYLEINDVLYEVIGILTDITADEVDVRIFLPFRSLEKELQQELSYIVLTQSGQVSCGSNQMNKGELMNELSELTTWMEQLCPLQEVDNEVAEERLSQQQGALRLSQKISFLLIVVALINCLVVSSLWIQKREKEYAIRRTYGQSMIMLVSRIYARLLVCELISGSFVLIVKLSTVGFDKLSSYLVYVVIAMLGVAAMTILIPAYRIAKFEPAQILRREDG